jgi:hypothetical protein
MPVSDLAASDITGVPYDQWQLYAGASKVAAVATNDGDTTIIRSGKSNYRQCFNVSWPSFIGKVNSLVAKGYLKYVTAAWNAGVGCRNSAGEDMSNVGMTASYALYTRTCSRPGGGSWGPSDCASGVTWLQVMCYTSPGSGNVPCTQLWFTLDYDVAGSCVIIQILSVLLPFLGPGLTLAQMDGINRLLYRLARTRLRPDEYAAALASLREWRRPRSVFLTQPAML